MKRVSVFMDVEDPINPLADDAALDLALLFTEAGVRGSFCITGEKCRVLSLRHRFDVGNAYRPHSLGLHTDTHSYHPTTMELLETCTFEEGCEAALATEGKGMQAFQSLFDRIPAYWGGAGNTWSPEITDAIKRLGMQGYVYAQTRIPNEGVHHFNGMLALPQALSVSELDWADNGRAAEQSARVLQWIAKLDQPWLGVFVGHPTKFRHQQYWDTPYFAGRTPPTPEFVEPWPVETYERSKRNLKAFLGELKSKFEIVGADRVFQLPWTFRAPTSDEAEFFRTETSRALRAVAGWPPHRKGLSAEKIVAKTLALESTLEIAGL